MIGTFFDTAIAFWPFWLLIGFVIVAKVVTEILKQRRLARSGIAEIDVMDGRTFETFLDTLFRRLGYKVELTRFQGDYGADLVVKKDGKRTAVQAKRWRRPVGLKAVQEAVAAKGYYNCLNALVVANQPFTSQAKRLALANSVEVYCFQHQRTRPAA